MPSPRQVLTGVLGLGLTVTGFSLALPTPAAQAVGGVFISEFHYDDGTTNDDGGIGEFVEITAGAGTDLTSWKVQLVNGNGNVVYNTVTLAGTVADQSDGWGTKVVDYNNGLLQNGSPDGIALLNASDTVVEFVSYEGAMTASLGTPPVSTPSADTGATAVETNSTPSTHSLQRNTDGSWAAPAVATKGTPNGYDTGGDPEPDPLTVTAPGNKTGVVNTAISPFTVAATGGTAPYSWSATGLPSGVSIHQATGEVSGTPTATCTCTVTVTATDSAGTPATDDATFTFTVSAPAEIVPIHEVQGTGARSPFAPADGNGAGAVKSVEGIVTALYRTGGFNGMFVQTAGTGGATDATPGASDALFVFGGANAVNIPSDIVIGDSVQVTGPVSEFFSSTQITPAAGGVVELASPLAPVTGLEIAYPTTETAREAQEGMLLAPNDTFTVTNTFQTNGFAEIGLATGDVPLKQPTEFAAPGDTAALQAIVADNAARAVTLDDAATINYLSNQTNKAIPLPWLTGTSSPPRVGAEATLKSPVILEFRNSIWKFQPRSQVTGSGSDVVTFEDTRATNVVPADVGGDISIATFNVLNYFNTTGEAYAAAGPVQNPPLDTFCTYFTDRQSNRIGNDSCGVRLQDDPATPTNEANRNDGRGPRGAATQVSLERQEAKLVHAINSLDASVIALEEMENSIKLPGETNRDDAVAHLVQLLNDAAGEVRWKFVKSPGEATTASAVAEQDVIRPAFIYQPALVTPVGQSDILFGTTEFANAREPLAQAFKAAGAPNSDAFAVIVNHFKSKGDNASPAPPATGDNANDPYVGAFNGDRMRQANRLVQFADDFAAARDIEAVFLAGDFNSYTHEAPIQALEDGGFELVESTDDPLEESYSFSGLSGSLDHVLGNTAAMGMVTGADIWQINANESIAYQYSRYNYNATLFYEANNPFATSDHNPEIVGLDVPEVVPTTTKQVQVLGTNDFHGRLLPDGGNAAGAGPYATAINELRAEYAPGNTIFTAAGDLIGASTFESFIQDDEPTIDALNAMGLEVSAAGNHEFDQGYEDFVGRVQDRANWEYIATNVDEPEGRDDLAESWTKTIDGVDFGFVGAVTEDLPALVNPAGMTDVGVLDIVDSVNSEAAALKAGGADVIVLLVHEGSPTTDCLSASFTDPATVWGNIVQNTSADVDAIISGHTHLAYNCRYTVQDWVDESRTVTRRPVVSAGQYGTNLNQLVFNFDTTSGALVEIEQNVIGTAGVGYEPDPTVQAIVQDAVDFAEIAGAEVLGQMEGPFNRAVYQPASGQTENRGGESTLGNLVAEVQRWATQLPEAGVESDIAFMNPGGLRADMTGETPTNAGDPRDLTFRQAANVQPFANTLVNMVLTGAQIETVLEQQWQRTAQGGVPSRPFLRLGVSDGFTYTYVETPVTVSVPNSAPVSTFRGEVTGMWLDGEPIDPASTYSVTVNSFLGTGGDNFHELASGTNKVDTGKVDLQAMVDYMAQFDTVVPENAPLPVDYSQRAVEVEFPNTAPDVYAPGDNVVFDVSSWTMSTADDVKDNAIQVKLGDTVLGTAPLDNAIGTQPYDTYGKAAVSVPLPADLETGDHELTLVGAQTGTEIPVTVAVERETTDVQILGTNDFHGRLLPDGLSGAQDCSSTGVGCPAALLAGAVKQLRTENPNTVFAAAGDLVGASTFESFIQNDEPTIDALNEAGLEVSAAGNHEFDQGYEDLVGRVQARADWEYIAANVEEPAGRDDLAETWTKDFGDVRVGFVGAVTEELPSLVSPAGMDGVTVTDIVDATNTAAAELKAGGADMVVLLVHEGSPSTDCSSANFTDPGTAWGNITQNVSADVDAIVSGHTHLAYNCSFPVQAWVDGGREVTQRPVVSSGQYGQNLNKLVFTVDAATGDVVAKTQSILALTEANFTEDPATVTIVHDAKAQADVLGAAVLGQIEAPFNRAKLANGTTENRGGESTLGNLVAEVQRWATDTPETGSAQIAFMNPGGLRQDMAGTVNGDARDVTYKQAAVVQPFANTLVNMDLTGAQIETVLEQQWQRTADDASGTVPTRPFLRLGVSDGFEYTYVETPVTVNGTSTFQGEVAGMWLDGVAIDPAATYSVTVNSFLASGGDNFRAFRNGTGKADTGKVDLQAMVDYLDEFGPTGSPLAVDYSQRAVEVHNVADSYSIGGDVTFDVASWTMSTVDDVKDAEIQVLLGDTELGTATLDNTIGTAVYDAYGRAHVDVPIPAGTPTGPQTLTLVGAATGTEVRVPIVVGRARATVSGADVTVRYGSAATMAVTVTADGVVPTGQVSLSAGDVVLGSATLVNGRATVRIPARSLPRGVHEVTISYDGDASVAPGTGTATVTVRNGPRN